MSAPPRRCLVTGGLGFIGSTLALAETRRGSRVVIVDNLLEGCGGMREHAADAGAEVVIGDARDEALMMRLVKDCDVVYSLAGKVSHVESMSHPYDDLEHNMRAPLVTLEAVRHANPRAKVIFASTRQVYGVPDYLPVDEQHPTRPVDVNGIHKLAAEWYHSLYSRVYGIHTVCLRLTNTYGPRQLIKHNRQGFMGWFIRCVLVGDTITVFGDGKQERDLAFVDDVVEALQRVTGDAVPSGSVLNVPGADVLPLGDLARTMCEAGGGGRVVLAPFPPERRSIDVGTYRGDGRKLTELTGWTPRVALPDGLRQTFAYFRAHQAEYLGAA